MLAPLVKKTFSPKQIFPSRLKTRMTEELSLLSGMSLESITGDANVLVAALSTPFLPLFVVRGVKYRTFG